VIKNRIAVIVAAATALAGAVLTTTGLAWTAGLDEVGAKAIVDFAYRRAARVETSAYLGLTVQNAAFATLASTPKNSVEVYNAPLACLQNWLTQPNNYAAYGSRPTEIIVTGQGDEVLGIAQQARDEFKNITAAAALASAKQRLPDGHLKVFVAMTGLAQELQRDAYDLRVLDGGKLLSPYRAAFLTDWKAGSDGRLSGTMLYYFNLSKSSIAADGLLPLLLRTEADNDCAYKLSVDLASFR
jgi:hypothetical protein